VIESPEEVFEAAQPGQIVRYQLRGPATSGELAELTASLAAAHPGVTFVLTADGAESKAWVDND
jgi:hypothetical protein